VRPVTRIAQRIAEADKLGFTRMFVSKYNLKGIRPSDYKLKIVPITKVEEMARLLFQ
jgi:DNA repair protein RadA/Sms